MPLQRLLRTPSALSLVVDLQKKYFEARASLLRIRADRLRLARTGWRPQAPGETRLIRAAEWTVSRTGSPADFENDFDLEYRFVPLEENFGAFAGLLAAAPKFGVGQRIRIRGLELDESRFRVDGRSVCAAFYDLVLTLAEAPAALVVLPRLESYLEARFWAEVCRDVEAAFGRPRNSIRLEAEISTVGGVAEADEIVFELKDTLEAAVFDPRLLIVDMLKLESFSPRIPREHFVAGPWRNPEVRAAFQSLRSRLAQRGVRLDVRPALGAGAEEGAESPSLSMEVLRELVLLSYDFLKAWFQGQAQPTGRDWIDFDLMRSVVWSAIHSGFLREENYEAWKEEFGMQPFERGTLEDAALKTLDPLLRTAAFPESAFAAGFSILVDREKTQSGSPVPAVRNLA